MRLSRQFGEGSTSARLPAPVHRLFEAEAERVPAGVALKAEGESLTYAELHVRANQLAARMKDLGVGAESIVSLLCERSVNMVAAIFAVLKAGGAYMPIDPDAPPRRISDMLAESGAAVVLTGDGLPRGVEFAGQILNLADQELYRGSARHVSAQVQDNQLAYVIYTSGSTGTPKGVMVEHGALADLCQWYRQAYVIAEDARVLLLVSYTFDLSVKNIITPLIAGGTLVLAPPRPYHALAILELIEREGITLINCAPSAIYQVVQLAARSDYRQLASLRSLALGGEATNLARLRDWLGDSGCRCTLSNLYGPTECTDLAVGCTVDKTVINSASTAPLGRPIVTARAYVLGDDGKPRPPGSVGMLYLSGGGVARGYLGDPALTAEKFVPNPFHPHRRMYETGDLARRGADGALEFRGRADLQVKIRGYRIEPGEIESRLLEHGAVREAAVIAARDARDEVRLCAYYVADGEPELSSLREHLAQSLPAYMMPSTFTRLARLPLTPHGKVDRAALTLMAAG